MRRPMKSMMKDLKVNGGVEQVLGVGEQQIELILLAVGVNGSDGQMPQAGGMDVGDGVKTSLEITDALLQKL